MLFVFKEKLKVSHKNTVIRCISSGTLESNKGETQMIFDIVTDSTFLISLAIFIIVNIFISAMMKR